MTMVEDQQEEMILKIEAILFVIGEKGLTVAELSQVLEVDNRQIETCLVALKERYQSTQTALFIDSYAGHYRLMTKPQFVGILTKLAQAPKMTKLTQAALETLMIIAYQQPVTKVVIDQVRGVQSQTMVQKLELRGLIEEAGRLEQPGRPKLYQTTDYFLDYFGLSSLDDLPRLSVTLKNEETTLLNLEE